MAFQCCPRWSSSAKPFSLASTGAPHFQTKGSNAPSTRSSCSTATYVDQSPPATLSGNRYFLLLVDDYNRFMWVALLHTKDAAPTAIKRIQTAAERKSGRKLLALCTDRGGEFTSVKFTEYCTELGVGHQLTTVHAAAKWCRRVEEPDGGRDGQEHTQGEGCPGYVLRGGGRQHRGLHSQ